MNKWPRKAAATTTVSCYAACIVESEIPRSGTFLLSFMASGGLSLMPPHRVLSSFIIQNS